MYKSEERERNGRSRLSIHSSKGAVGLSGVATGNECADVRVLLHERERMCQGVVCEHVGVQVCGMCVFSHAHGIGVCSSWGDCVIVVWTCVWTCV